MKEYITITFIILLIIIIYYSYLFGKIKQENKNYKYSNKIQNKINKINSKVIDKKSLIKKLNKNKFIVLLSLLLINNCCRYNNKIYIHLQQYTKKEQQQIANFLETNNIEIIDKIVIDYYNLREIIKKINE